MKRLCIEELESRLVPSVSFLPPVNYAVGVQPGKLAVGRLLDHGNKDIVVANVSGGISVLMGNGDGTFQPAYTIGSGAFYGVALGKFNGHMDIVAADHGGDGSNQGLLGGVQVFLGDGHGHFASPQEYAIGHPHSVAVADLNGDSKRDIIVADDNSNSTPGHLTILWGHRHGAFSQGPSFDIGPGGYAVTTAHLNGHPDLVVSTLGGVTVFLGDGHGQFSSGQVYATGYGNDTDQATGIAVLPNGLAVGNFYSHTVSVLLSNGDGTLAPAVNYPVGNGYGPTDLAVGRWEGKPTIVTANHLSQTVSLLTELPDGTLATAQNLTAGNAPVAVAVGRFGTGGEDLVVSNALSNDVSVFQATL